MGPTQKRLPWRRPGKEDNTGSSICLPVFRTEIGSTKPESLHPLAEIGVDFQTYRKWISITWKCDHLFWSLHHQMDFKRTFFGFKGCLPFASCDCFLLDAHNLFHIRNRWKAMIKDSFSLNLMKLRQFNAFKISRLYRTCTPHKLNVAYFISAYLFPDNQRYRGIINAN